MVNENPFSINRAEYMKDLWRYYVPFSDLPNHADKAIIIEGGRGTGKSMYFLCNSWHEQYAEFEGSKKNPIDEFIGGNQLGIYYKVDSTFVGAMNSLGITDIKWHGIFNTYLSISLVLDLIPFVKILVENSKLDLDFIYSFTKAYYRVLRDIDINGMSLDDMKDDCHSVLQEVEDLLNGKDNGSLSFRPTQPGSIFKYLVELLRSESLLSEMVFKVYIDEYESFSEWQQIIVNTLIKQSSYYLIYNVGMRHNGMKTPQTLGEDEVLQATHDYLLFNFDDFLSQDKEYFNSLKAICKKRFLLSFEKMGLSYKRLPTDIEFYLSNYDAAREAERYIGRQFSFYNSLQDEIRKHADKGEDPDKAISILCSNVPPINARLHLALLYRTKKFRPSISYLCEAYQSWEKNKKNEPAKKYREWLHNAKNGLIFLLNKECGINKWYYGFDTFAMLSSGVIRYFLELCEQAFNIAMMESFSWENPAQISPEIQTRAAKYVSQSKINEIVALPLCGKRLRIFTQCFGEICRDLHRNENNTLGEPEVNHFTTASLQLSPEIDKHLNEAVTHLVFQRLPQTKSKSTIRTDILDYHLNKIYTPYFEISYNKKRKIMLKPELLEELLSADIDRANRAAHRFLDEYWGRKLTQKQNSSEVVEQLGLF